MFDSFNFVELDSRNYFLRVEFDTNLGEPILWCLLACVWTETVVDIVIYAFSYQSAALVYSSSLSNAISKQSPYPMCTAGSAVLCGRWLTCFVYDLYLIKTWRTVCQQCYALTYLLALLQYKSKLWSVKSKKIEQVICLALAVRVQTPGYIPKNPVGFIGKPAFKNLLSWGFFTASFWTVFLVVILITSSTRLLVKWFLNGIWLFCRWMQ